MNLKDFNDLLSLLEIKAKEQNQSYKSYIMKENQEVLIDNALSEDTKKALIREVIDSPQFIDINNYLKNDFNNLSDSFKNQIIKFYNDNFIDLFSEHWMKDFYLLRDIINIHLELNYQKKIYNFPYEDCEKYDERIATIVKKCKSFIIPKLQPYEMIKFFQHKAKELISINSLILFTNVKREKEQYKNEVIFKLILIIADGNYKRDIMNKSNMRLTKKTSLNYSNELEQYKMQVFDNSTKKYQLKP